MKKFRELLSEASQARLLMGNSGLAWGTLGMLLIRIDVCCQNSAQGIQQCSLPLPQSVQATSRRLPTISQKPWIQQGNTSQSASRSHGLVVGASCKPCCKQAATSNESQEQITGWTGVAISVTPQEAPCTRVRLWVKPCHPSSADDAEFTHF